ncbi:Collagen alpha-1(XIV) chain [Bagarius yarrelli]|uniref:Collagen alpha-1(XIV) chain n=1 Tax=Bagarius yarrelli TaxID=175774 RepID=A0A556VAM3_BAGYA|nr:Collagen alpha-1(XIV) chain [Bagarius yarrelli]
MQVVRLRMMVWWQLIFLALVQFPEPTKGQIPGPRRLRFKVMGPDKLHVLWKEPKGEYDGYRFIYSSVPDGERTELRIKKGQSRAIINDFNPMKEYTVKVIAVSGSQQSRALEGSFAAQAQEFDEEEESQPQTIKEMPTEDSFILSEAHGKRRRLSDDSYVTHIILWVMMKGTEV